MRIIMRIFFLMCILGASLTIAAQNIIYGNKNEQRAINMAFDILQVYYHSKELCVSDSILVFITIEQPKLIRNIRV